MKKTLLVKKTVLDYTLKVRLPLTLFVILCSIVLTYFISRPERDGVGYGPDQPIKFSHKLHAGTMGIDCRYCHTGADKSRHAMIPSVSTCMNCHSVARKDRPEIIKLTKYFNENRPIPWKRIHRVPDFVYFNHSVHVNRGVKCQTCHGEVQNMDVVAQMNSFVMSACLNCHRNAPQMLPYIKNIKYGPQNCFACHR
ncbi:MAG: cytochrome c3 family protein [Acidobacteriota bacterium]